MAILLAVIGGLLCMSLMGIGDILVNDYEGIARVAQYIWGGFWVVGGIITITILAREIRKQGL